MALVDLKLEELNSFTEHPYKAGHMICIDKKVDAWEPSKRNGNMLNTQYKINEKLVTELKKQCLELDLPRLTVLNLLVDNEMPIEEASQRIDEWFEIEEPVMQSVNIEYNDERVNYCTSIAPHCTQEDVNNYFEDADNVVFLSQNVKCTAEQQTRLKVCTIYYPENKQFAKWAIIDPELNAAVGFAKGQIFHPRGGYKAVNDIVDNKMIAIGSRKMSLLTATHLPLLVAKFEELKAISSNFALSVQPDKLEEIFDRNTSKGRVNKIACNKEIDILESEYQSIWDRNNTDIISLRVAIAECKKHIIITNALNLIGE